MRFNALNIHDKEDAISDLIEESSKDALSVWMLDCVERTRLRWHDLPLGIRKKSWERDLELMKFFLDTKKGFLQGFVKTKKLARERRRAFYHLPLEFGDSMCCNDHVYRSRSISSGTVKTLLVISNNIYGLFTGGGWREKIPENSKCFLQISELNWQERRLSWLNQVFSHKPSLVRIDRLNLLYDKNVCEVDNPNPSTYWHCPMDTRVSFGVQESLDLENTLDMCDWRKVELSATDNQKKDEKVVAKNKSLVL